MNSKSFYFRFVAFLIAMVFVRDCYAQKPWLSSDEMPNAVRFLPPHPDSASAAFAYDSAQYAWGKEQRLDSARLALAKRDAEWSVDNICSIFSVPFGMTISQQNTPQLYKLLLYSLITTDQVGKRPKDYYSRIRPYVHFGEPTIAPGDEDVLRHNGSYPSGHTILGWSAALLLSEINPDASDTILACGYEYGQSRVIAGYHWQSDVDAGRLAASAAVARLHADKRFQKQMKRAQREYARKATPSAARLLEAKLDRLPVKALSIASAESKGIALHDMEVMYNGSIAFPGEQLEKPIADFSTRLWTYLRSKEFSFGSATVVWCRFYCSPDGSPQYCLFRFYTAEPPIEKQEQFARLLEQFMRTNSIDFKRDYRFAFCATFRVQ